MTTPTTAEIRNEIRKAAHQIDIAAALVANLADHEPIDFEVGDRLYEARLKLAAALERI